ncbi:hypothetical protein BD01_0767 [Thermococcus nautili]|uniref:Uncharacterized protein n=1 Tax=Thermococcus nautili TaxID=195522 RepID=W8PJW7_9EURY|nr:hypothetical protein BD01_0767 [Thermococcus nautili]
MQKFDVNAAKILTIAKTGVFYGAELGFPITFRSHGEHKNKMKKSVHKYPYLSTLKLGLSTFTLGTRHFP